MRLIDADKFMETVQDNHYLLSSRCNSIDYGMFTIGIQQAVDEAPTIDAVEVKHGKWIIHTENFSPYQRCSVCGFEIPLIASNSEKECYLYKHCPECTARMDGAT